VAKRVRISPKVNKPSHDIGFVGDNGKAIGINLEGGWESFGEIAATPSTVKLNPGGSEYGDHDPGHAHVGQTGYNGGRGREMFRAGQNMFFDSKEAWTMSEDRLLPGMMARWGTGYRNVDQHMSDDVNWVSVRGSNLHISTLFTSNGVTAPERYDMAIKIMHEFFWDAVRSGGADLPPSFWKIAFPLQPNKKRPGDADTLLVNAIIRAESLFDRSAFSRAGAIGLMQLMPATARRLARKLKIPPPSDKALFDPALNVRLGARYLGALVKEFKGELAPAIASYNAGESAVKRWWNKRGEEPVEVFIERIPYQETRDYVKKVLGYLHEYRRIYGKRRSAPEKSKR